MQLTVQAFVSYKCVTVDSLYVAVKVEEGAGRQGSLPRSKAFLSTQSMQSKKHDVYSEALLLRTERADSEIRLLPAPSVKGDFPLGRCFSPPTSSIATSW